MTHTPNNFCEMDRILTDKSSFDVVIYLNARAKVRIKKYTSEISSSFKIRRVILYKATLYYRVKVSMWWTFNMLHRYKWIKVSSYVKAYRVVAPNSHLPTVSDIIDRLLLGKVKFFRNRLSKRKMTQKNNICDDVFYIKTKITTPSILNNQR